MLPRGQDSTPDLVVKVFQSWGKAVEQEGLLQLSGLSKLEEQGNCQG